MNRGRVAKKDYQKILKDMPTDKAYPTYSKNLNQILDQRTGNSYTMAFFNERSLSPKNHKTDFKADGLFKDKVFKQYQKKGYTRQQQLSKRIKTMQRSIDLYDKRRQNSFDKFLKKQFKPLKEFKKQSKSPYSKKLTRQSLNITSKQKNLSSLHNSNRILRQGIQPVFSHRGKVSSKRSLKGTQSSKTMIKYTQEQILSKGRLAHQQGKIDLSIQYFNELLKINHQHLEANYLLGVAYMNKNQFVKSLKHFDVISNLKPDYSKNVYVLAAICCKKLSLYQQSQKRLTKCIELFPDNADAFLYRAKIFLKQNMIDDAIVDFQVAGKLQPNRAHSYIGQGDCYVSKNDIQKALTFYKQALRYNPPIIIYLKMAECQLAISKFNDGLNNINLLLQKQFGNEQALFLKAQILVKLKRTSDANMIFEQILRTDNQRFLSKVIQQMAKIKISQRDFYAAQHILQRQSYLDLDILLLQRIKKFTEAVIYLMKRKFTDGVQLIEGLAKKYKYFDVSISQTDITDDFLKPLVNVYVAYGYYCLGQFKNSLKHYQIYMTILQRKGKQNKIMIGAKYNFELCQAMLNLEKKKFTQALQKFQNSVKILPNKIQSFFFRAVTILQLYYQNQKQQEQTYNEAINILTSGITLAKDSNDTTVPYLYYMRGALYGGLSMWRQCLSDIDYAIQKSDDTVPKFFYLRGCAFGCCQNYKQAIHDLTICLNVASNYQQAFLLRSNCLQLQGQTNQAFEDLQRYITLKPEDPSIHKYAGHLLFQNGAFEDSILAYQHGQIDPKKDIDIFSTRAKAYLLLGQFQQSVSDLKSICTNSKDVQSEADLEIVQILYTLQSKQNINQKVFQQILSKISKLIQSSLEGKIFKFKQYWMLRGSIYAFTFQYQKSIQNFRQCLKFRQAILKQSTIQNEVPDVQELQQYYVYCNHMKYNISLCYYADKNFKKALEMAKEINVDKNKPDDIELWINIIQNQINANKNLQLKAILQKTNEIQVFSLKNKLSKHLPYLTLNTTNNSSFKIKLCLSFPKVQPPEINITFDKGILKGIDYSDIDSKPQAPWIRKQNNCVMFTSTIQVFDNLDLQTQSRTKRNQGENQNSMVFQNQFYNENIGDDKPDIQQLKQKLKLEDKVTNRLNKLLNK